MTQIPDDTPDSFDGDQVDEVQDTQVPSPEEMSRDFTQDAGNADDPGSMMNPQ